MKRESILSDFNSFNIIEPLREKFNEDIVHDDDLKNFRYNRPIEYWLILIGYAIGYGSFWRFPYLIYTCGGGVFLIPFMFFFILIGIPVFTLENALGQIFKKGPVEVFEMMRKKYIGVGWAAVITSWLISLYYSIILCWSFYYFFLSFISPLPWSYEALIEQNKINNVSNSNYNNTNNSTFQPDSDVNYINFDYFKKEVLRLSNGIHEMGSLNSGLVACLFITYVSIFVCIYEGIKSSSKVVYITCPAPIILMLILLINVLTLPGYELGIKYLFLPNLSRLYEIDVWIKACNQVIFMLALGIGGNVLFSTFRKDDEDVYQSSLWIPIITVLFGLLCSVINFAYLGHFSYLVNIPIEELPLSGTDLAFITYPSALCMLPFPNLWSIMFFLMLITLGIDSQFGFNEIVSHYVFEVYLHKYVTRTQCSIIVCITGFLLGLPFLAKGGFYLFELVDDYATLFSCFTIIFFEAFLVSKYIGVDVLKDIIANKTGKVIPNYVFFSIQYASPIAMAVLVFFSLERVISKNAKYKVLWPYALQWILILAPLVAILYFYFKYSKNSEEEEKHLLKKSLERMKDSTIISE